MQKTNKREPGRPRSVLLGRAAPRFTHPAPPTPLDGEPSSSDGPGSRRQWPTPHGMVNVDRSGKRAGPTGNELGRETTRMRWWPTVTANDSFGGGSRNAENTKAHAGTSLSDAVITGSGATGRQDESGKTKGRTVKLNPDFVDWLMGWPPGWSACAPLGTESIRYVERLRCAYSQIVRGSRCD